MKPQTIFIIIWAIGAIFVLTRLFLSGKKALSIFPDIGTVLVHYRDKTASGNSTQSWKTKMGGAKNVLDIVITDKELWLKSMLLFAGVCKQFDLLHKIPLSNITKVTEEGKSITIDFKSDDGKNKQVVVQTKRPDVFVNTLGKGKLKAQDRLHEN